MKLGLFTPVFAKLSVKDMLAKVRSLEKVKAIELGTGAWPGSDHVEVDTYLKDKNRASDFRKMICDAGLTISALSCHGDPLHPNPARSKVDDEIFRKTVQLAEQLEVPVVVTFSGCPGDSETATHPNWVITPWPPEFLEVLEWQWGEEGHSLLDEGVGVRARSRRQGSARGAPGLHCVQRRERAETAGCVRRQPRRQFRSQPFFLAGSGCAGGDSRTGAGDFSRARQGRLSRSSERRGQRRPRYENLSPHGGALVALPKRGIRTRRVRMEAHRQRAAAVGLRLRDEHRARRRAGVDRRRAESAVDVLSSAI